jgi:hypothetical protein
MTMAKTLTLSLALVALLGLPLAWSAFASAQDPPAPKDDALDGLLKKLEEKGSKPAEPDKPATKGELGTKDKDLDSLLEKLGRSEDKTAPEDRPNGPGGRRGEPQPGDQPPAGKTDKQKKSDPNALSGKAKQIDEHLEEILGKRRKKRQQEGEDSGPLSQIIKEMREVQERLGKPDTGEETRKKQEQIVKQIEKMIEQMRNSQSQSKSQRKSLAIRQGRQPGQQPGDQPGNNGGYAPNAKPQKPTTRRSLAGGKEVWGDLPPELRQELDNVMREEFLTTRQELIERYFLSLSKKKPSRGD